ncbi:MAG: hypothetical protein F4025_02415, partial [Synechococcus sp. SB0669_bin_7]|nr:hypothetical protein [Synechococcus sp. SB0675_bin_7]MYK85274.1 hypothetical protein [Synechococcus sp. SB0669_bin_7]
LAAGIGYEGKGRKVHTLTIVDNDAPPLPAVSIAGGSSVTEGGTATFTLSASPAPSAAVTVQVAVTDSGGFVAAVQTGPRQVSVGADGTGTLMIATSSDGVDEPNGAVTATIEDGVGYAPHATEGTASVAVSDDDPTVVTLSAPAGDVAETGGRKVLTVGLDRALVAPEALAVPLVFRGTATRGVDYTLSCGQAAGVACQDLDGAAPRIVFTGQSGASRTGTLTLASSADGIDEGAGERVEVALGGLDENSGTALSGGAAGSGTASFRITDDDQTTALTVTPAFASLNEGETLSVTVSGIPAAYGQVRLAASGGAVRDTGSTPGADYRLLDAADVVLGASHVLTPSGGSVTFKVVVLADESAEVDESVVLKLVDPSGRLDVALGTLTLKDGLGSTGVKISRSALTVPEGIGGGAIDNRYTVVLTRAPDVGETVTVSARSADKGAVWVMRKPILPAEEYIFPLTAEFTSTNWDQTRTFLVGGSSDADADHESVVISHTVQSTGGVYAGATAGSVTVGVIDDEAPIPVSVSASSSSMTEGGVATFRVTAERLFLDKVKWRPVTIALTVTATGAFAASDQTGTREVTIAPGQRTATLTVRTVNDDAIEPDGTVTATVVDGTHYTAGATPSATVAVRDEDGDVEVGLAMASGDISEADGFHRSKSIHLRLSRPLLSGETLRVPLVLGGTAERGSDYTLAPATSSARVSYANLSSVDPANPPTVVFTGPTDSLWKQTVVVNLVIVDDAVQEGLGETVTVTTGTISEAGIQGRVTVRITTADRFRILDDDAPVLTVTPSSVVLHEDRRQTFTISDIPAAYSQVRLAASGSAVRDTGGTSGADYRLLDAADVVLGASHTLTPSGGAVTFKVQTLADEEEEEEEMVTLSLVEPGGVLNAHVGVVTLRDGPRPVAGVAVSETALDLMEWGAAGSYTVVLTKAPAAGDT